MKNILSSSERFCSGCSACSAICPKSAITMEISKEGFFAPVVDNELCTDCGLCQKVCSKFVAAEESTSIVSEKQVFGVHSTNETIHFTTTSGGFAHELSAWGLVNGYKILGVIYDYDKDVARSIIIGDIDQLPLLKGSKYIQSNAQEAFDTLLKEAAKTPEQKYICIGTPCQIFGLRQLINSRHLKNKFILVDLFCHGVPSYLVWHPYIQEKKQVLGTIRNVNFRYKGNGWHQYTMKLDGEKGIYQQYAYKDLFFRYFFDNIALNSACFTCPVRKKYSSADIRIGDFLGRTYERREDGVSAVVPVTQIGREVIVQLQSSGSINKGDVWPASEALKSQSTMDYGNIALRNKVIERLSNRGDLHSTLKWYFQQMSLSFKVKSILKRFATLLPNGFIIRLRRMVR